MSTFSVPEDTARPAALPSSISYLPALVTVWLGLVPPMLSEHGLLAPEPLIRTDEQALPARLPTVWFAPSSQIPKYLIRASETAVWFAASVKFFRLIVSVPLAAIEEPRTYNSSAPPARVLMMLD